MLTTTTAEHSSEELAKTAWDLFYTKTTNPNYINANDEFSINIVQANFLFKNDACTNEEYKDLLVDIYKVFILSRSEHLFVKQDDDSQDSDDDSIEIFEDENPTDENPTVKDIKSLNSTDGNPRDKDVKSLN